LKPFILVALLRAAGVVLATAAGVPAAAAATPAQAGRGDAPGDAVSRWSLQLDWRLAPDCTTSRPRWPLTLRWMPIAQRRSVRLVVDACLPAPLRPTFR
jgi:hypothetical protein